MYHLWQISKCNSLTSPEVELVGGSGPHEGNIHVGGLPVCDDGHGAENAQVVCRFDQTHRFNGLVFNLAIKKNTTWQSTIKSCDLTIDSKELKLGHR